jgi:hypothetical protein
MFKQLESAFIKVVNAIMGQGNGTYRFSPADAKLLVKSDGEFVEKIEITVSPQEVWISCITPDAISGASITIEKMPEGE